MAKQSDKLVNHLTDSLAGNPEAQLATRHLLTERFASVEPEAIEQELEKFQNPPQGKRDLFLRKYRVPLFLGLNLLLFLALALPLFLKAQSTRVVLEEFEVVDTYSEVEEFDLMRSQLPKKDQAFVFGDLGRHDGDRFLTHFQNNPEDPAALALHLLSSDSTDSELFELGKRLEPQNSFFPLLEASANLNAATIINPASEGQNTDPEKPRRLISDPELFSIAMDQLRAALQLPQYENYVYANLTRQLAILPPETDLRSRRKRQLVKEYYFGDYTLFGLLEAIQIQAIANLRKQEFQEFRDLFDLSVSIPDHYCQKPDSVSQDLLTSSYWPLLSKTFSQPEFKRHLTTNQQEQLQVIVEFCEDLQDSQDYFDYGNPTLEGVGPETYESLFWYDGDYTKLVPPYTAEELTPERLYWQSALERLAAFAMAILFFLFSLVLFAPFKKKKPLHQIASKSEQPIPSARLLVYSTLVTIAALSAHLAITRLTPLGGLERSWSFYQYFPQIPNLLILACLTLVLTFNFARYLVRKRLAPLHLANPLRWFSWWPAILVLLLYPLTALYKFYEDPPTVLWEVLAEYLEKIPLMLLGIFSLWLLWLLFRSLTGDRTNQLSRKLIARYTAYLLIVPTLVATLANPLLYANETKWFKRDHFLSTNENPYGLNRVASDVTLALFQRQKDLNQKLTEMRAQAPPQ